MYIANKWEGVTMEQDINSLIEELTKVRPDELSTEGLKLFNKINEIIDKNKELEEENKIIKGNYYTLCVDIQMVTSELGFPEDTIIADEMIPMIKENYIPVSLVEETIEELNKKEQELQNSISDEEREEYSDANISFELMDIEIRRSVLQELLEENSTEKH